MCGHIAQEAQEGVHAMLMFYHKKAGSRWSSKTFPNTTVCKRCTKLVEKRLWILSSLCGCHSHFDVKTSSESCRNLPLDSPQEQPMPPNRKWAMEMQVVGMDFKCSIYGTFILYIYIYLNVIKFR